MLNKRHLMKNEKAILREMADSCGVVEMLRTLAGIVGHDIADIETANMHKSAILKVANCLNNEKCPVPTNRLKPETEQTMCGRIFAECDGRCDFCLHSGF